MSAPAFDRFTILSNDDSAAARKQNTAAVNAAFAERGGVTLPAGRIHLEPYKLPDPTENA